MVEASTFQLALGQQQLKNACAKTCREVSKNYLALRFDLQCLHVSVDYLTGNHSASMLSCSDWS